jgi:hypothetical protein
LVVGGYALGAGFERKGNREEKPELARVTRSAEGRVEGADRGEKNNGEVEGVGEEEAGGGRTIESEVEDEEQREEKSGCDSESRKPAGGEHDGLAGI